MTSIAQTTDKTKSTSYVGKSDFSATPSMTTFFSGGFQEKFYFDSKSHPSSSISGVNGVSGGIPENLWTTKEPRHGEKVTSPLYIPPVATLIRNNSVRVKGAVASDWNTTDKVVIYKEYNGALNYRSRLFFLQTCINSLTAKGMSPSITSALTTFLTTFNNRNTVYNTTVPSTVTSSVSLKATNATSFGSGSIVPSAGTTEPLILFVNGTVTFASGSINTTNRSVIVIATGAITVDAGAWGVPGSNSVVFITPSTIECNLTPGATNLYLLTTGSNPISGNVGTNGTNFYYNGNYVPNSSTIAPIYDITATEPVKVSNQGTHKFFETHEVEDNLGYTLARNNNYMLPNSDVYALIDNSTGSMTPDQITAIKTVMGLQMSHQYGGATTTTSTTSPFRYSHTSTSTNQSDAYVALEVEPDSLPNIGVLTEPSGTEYYHENMAQTYRVNKDVVAFGTDGHYMTIDKDINIRFSTDILEIDQPYTIGDVEVAPVTVTTMNDVLGTDLVGGEGGSDDFYKPWFSKYRVATVKPSEPMPVIITGKNKNVVAYCPYGGKVSSATCVNDATVTEDVDFKILDGILYVNNNLPHKSRAITFNVTISSTQQAALKMRARANVAAHLDVTEAGGAIVTYADENMVLVRYQYSQADSEVLRPVRVSSNQYYSFTSASVQMQYATNNAGTGMELTIDSNSPIPITLGGAVVQETITVVAFFGDLEGHTTVAGEVSSIYRPHQFMELRVNKNTNELFSFFDKSLVLHLQPVDPIYLTAWETDRVVEYGFENIDSGESLRKIDNSSVWDDNEHAKLYRMHFSEGQQIVSDRLIIGGYKEFEYTDSQTSVKIMPRKFNGQISAMKDGTDLSIGVSNGNVILSVFPFIYANHFYNAVREPTFIEADENTDLLTILSSGKIVSIYETFNVNLEYSVENGILRLNNITRKDIDVIDSYAVIMVDGVTYRFVF